MSMKRYLERDDSNEKTEQILEKKRILKTKFEKLNEGDNPILMIVKLKE